jgi:hypothetical protein
MSFVGTEVPRGFTQPHKKINLVAATLKEITSSTDRTETVNIQCCGDQTHLYCMSL